MPLKREHFFEFGDFRLDVDEKTLRRAGLLIPLTPKVFETLKVFVENPGQLIEKSEFMERIWPGRFVEESNLSFNIKMLRKALSDDAHNPRFIETVPSRGFRFVANVSAVSESVSEPQTLADLPISTEIPPRAIYGTALERATNPKHSGRIILFTVGFASAVILIFMLSFNFRLGFSPRPLEKPHTTNREAYRLFIQGKALVDREEPDIPKAIEYFEQAVHLDPNFAAAYAELAGAHSSAFDGGGRKATEGYLKAKAAIEKALAIDETLAEAHSYLGIVKSNYEWDFAGAELEHKRAVELKPNSSTAHLFYGLLLGTIGKSDEAIAEMKTAIDLDPASPTTRHSYGWVLFQSRRYDEAIAEELQVVEMDPNLIMANNVLMNSYDKKGDDDKSFEYFVRLKTLLGETPDEIETLKAIYTKSGWRGVFERQLEEAKADEKDGKPNYANLAGISIQLGQNKQALDYLEKAVDQNKFTLITLKVNPRYDPLRGDPGFDDLLRRVGLE